MAYLKPLEKNLVGLIKLLKQPEEIRQALVKGLQDAPLSLDPSKPVYEAVAKIDNLSDEDAGEIAEALLTLFAGRAARSEGTTAAYIDDIIETIEDGSEAEEPFEESERESIRQHLTHILEVEPMEVSAKAAGIMFEHERLYAHAKVFSDLRPVFGRNVEEAPKTAIILHNLAIHYYQDNKHQEFFVVLDTSEVESLIETLERAKKKAATLKALLAAANVPYVEAE